ncbi:hypothetical protein Cgig2_017260 [Carnegiea gigantea]|uniref:Uncharacterized protein n=1 Tax=Carnegiea gigantea TaxID=171969 RepID=A0A9Q1GXM7_9CARY|nr:hypothetical protein Cgig2_017260 [Carnegiea gigantea]
MIEAPPEVWQNYLMATPDAKTFLYKRVPHFYKLDLLFGKDRATGRNAAGPKERQRQWSREVVSSSEDAPPILTNKESSCALPSKVQVESKKSKNKAIEFMCEELRSLRSGMDVVAMALEEGNLRNYSEEQVYDEITQVKGLSEILQMKVYQALSADLNSARAFPACPVARHELWLKVKFGNEFLE